MGLRARADSKEPKADCVVFFQSEGRIGNKFRQSARVAFFVTAVGLDETVRGSDGFNAVAEVLSFHLAFRTESSLVFFFDPIDFGLDDVFERLPEEVCQALFYQNSEKFVKICRFF